MSFVFWGTPGMTVNGNMQVTMTYVAPPPPPVCACGAPATQRLTRVDHGSGQQTHFLCCLPCQDRIVREAAIENAPTALANLFRAVEREQRARLYKQLAIVFHPDQGGDARLMTVLNAVRKEFP